MTLVESTRIHVPETADSFTIRSDEPEDLSSIKNDQSAACSMTTPTISDDSRDIPSQVYSIRRHPEFTGVPILLLLRYMSTIWVSELASTSFATQSMQHTAVSGTKLLIVIITIMISVVLLHIIIDQ